MNLNTLLNVLLVGVIAYFVFNTFFTNGYEKLDQATAYAQLQEDKSIKLVDVESQVSLKLATLRVHS